MRRLLIKYLSLLWSEIKLRFFSSWASSPLHSNVVATQDATNPAKTSSKSPLSGSVEGVIDQPAPSKQSETILASNIQEAISAPHSALSFKECIHSDVHADTIDLVQETAINTPLDSIIDPLLLGIRAGVVTNESLSGLSNGLTRNANPDASKSMVLDSNADGLSSYPILSNSIGQNSVAIAEPVTDKPLLSKSTEHALECIAIGESDHVWVSYYEDLEGHKWLLIFQADQAAFSNGCLTIE